MDEYVAGLKSKYSSLAAKANINQLHSSTALVDIYLLQTN